MAWLFASSQGAVVRNARVGMHTSGRWAAFTGVQEEDWVIFRFLKVSE